MSLLCVALCPGTVASGRPPWPDHSGCGRRRCGRARRHSPREEEERERATAGAPCPSPPLTGRRGAGRFLPPDTHTQHGAGRGLREQDPWPPRTWAPGMLAGDALRLGVACPLPGRPLPARLVGARHPVRGLVRGWQGMGLSTRLPSPRTLGTKGRTGVWELASPRGGPGTLCPGPRGATAGSRDRGGRLTQVSDRPHRPDRTGRQGRRLVAAAFVPADTHGRAGRTRCGDPFE